MGGWGNGIKGGRFLDGNRGVARVDSIHRGAFAAEADFRHAVRGAASVLAGRMVGLSVTLHTANHFPRRSLSPQLHVVARGAP